MAKQEKDVLYVIAATYADVVGASSRGSVRSTVAGWLGDAAVRAAGWSGVAATFPGLPERRS